ncbi:MAG: IS1595 family transposase [Clostridiales bacterium]|jgi:hypothetical protein|nr:IS1595 family transposase [Clostridiales bacterium]
MLRQRTPGLGDGGRDIRKDAHPAAQAFSAICAALQPSKDVGVSHSTAWLMMHKIRERMPSRDKKYLLSGNVEMDEAYFGASEKGGKRGGGATKTPALAALSLDALDHPQYARLEAATGVSGEDPRKFAVGGVAPGSTIKKRCLSPYKKLEGLFKVEQIKYDIIEHPDS